MREKRLSQLFVHYRRRGDVPALTAVFDATAPSLLGLAQHLVQSSGEAEDVVQATFLTAIERSETYDATFPLRPWLTGILVRKARQANERAAKRVEPDRVDERPPADPAQRASSAEFSADLRRALAALPERYRLVLLPFLHDGDRPRDIARRQGVAPGTVRVQIHRGLEQLRRALPPGYAIGAGAATVSTTALAALERIRASVATAAPAAVTVAAGGSAPTIAWAGSRVVSTVAAAALLGAGAWQIARPGTPQANEGTAAERLPRLDAAGPTTMLAPSSPATPAETPLSRAADETSEARAAVGAPPADTDTAPSPWVVAAVVTGFQGPRGETLHLSVEARGTHGRSAEASIRGDGRLDVALPSVPGGEPDQAPTLVLTVRHAAYAPFEYVTSAADVGEAGRIDVPVALQRERSLLSGRVAPCTDTSPVVAFFPATAKDQVGTHAQVSCADDGSFRLFTEHDHGWLVATATGCAPFGARLELAGPEDVDFGMLTLDPGATIEGIAYFEGRAPDRPGTVVAHNVASEDAAHARLDGVTLGFLEDGVVTDNTVAAADRAGAFRIAGLSPGLYDVLSLPPMTASGYYDPHTQGERVRAPTQDLELDSPLRVYTIDVVCEGGPVQDATVRFQLPNGSVAGPTQRDGTYPFTLASTDARHRVEVEKPGFRGAELLLGPQDFAGGRFEVELVRTTPPAELTLELALEHGPIGPLGLRLSLVGSDWYSYRKEVPTGGKLVYGEVPAGRHRLELWPELDGSARPAQQGPWLATEIELTCDASAAELVRVPLPQGGRVAFVVPELGAAGPGTWRLRGAGADGDLALLTWDATSSSVRTLDSPASIERDGEYWLRRALVPGEYHLDVLSAGGQERTYPFLVSPEEPASVFIELD